MKRLEGRVAIVTGAGSGLGRAHARLLASEGASVVVNDLGGNVHGQGNDPSPAERVVAEIVNEGGRAIPSRHDVADWEQAGDMIDAAIQEFGDLHVLVNNAGILRDRTLAKMTEEEWDAVIHVHLKGHAAPTRHAVKYWLSRAKAGNQVSASVVHTSSIAGFAGNFGQANYAAAKLALLALSRVVVLEAGAAGVRSNVISPSARTRLTQSVPSGLDEMSPPENPDEFDWFDPANVSPLVAWLSEASCPATSQVFHIAGSRLLVLSMPTIVHDLRTEGRWTQSEIERELSGRLIEHAPLEVFMSR